MRNGGKARPEITTAGLLGAKPCGRSPNLLAMGGTVTCRLDLRRYYESAGELNLTLIFNTNGNEGEILTNDAAAIDGPVTGCNLDLLNRSEWRAR